MPARHHSIALVAALLPLIALAAPRAQAQGVDNKGSEFFLGFLPNAGGGQTVELHLTADISTSVEVEYPTGTPLAASPFAVSPGEITIVPLPTTANTGWAFNAVSANLVHATAEQEFVAYMVNLLTFTSDAALALPVDALNTDYVIASGSQTGAEFVVFAPFDGTTVTIDPTVAIGSNPAGTPFEVNLDRGQGFFAQVFGELSGTTLSANRPIGLTNGNSCTQIPGGGGSGACDHVFEVAPPVQTWGSAIPVANLPLRSFGSIYRVFAAESDTLVLLDGDEIATLGRGQFVQVPATVVNGQEDLTGNHVFSSDKPILVVQHMTGRPNLGPPEEFTGDPAMGNMIPAAQYQLSYTFATPGPTQFTRQFVTVIAADADTDSITIEGTPVSPESDPVAATPIATLPADAEVRPRLHTPFAFVASSGLSAAVVEVEAGTYTTASSLPHGVTVEGYNNFDSYLYPGGAQFEFINPVGDANPPVCTLVTDSEDPLVLLGGATDDRPSEDTNDNGELDPGEDLNNNGEIDEDTGIFSVSLDEGAQNASLEVDSDFVPGDSSVSFTVREVEVGSGLGGSVRVSDGAGNTCALDLGDVEPASFPVDDWPQAFTLQRVEPLEGVEGAAQEGHRIGYLAAETAGVQVLDVTDSASIELLGTYRPESCDADGIEVLFFADDVYFVPEQHAIHIPAGPCGVHVVDVSGATDEDFEPTLLSVYDTPGWAESLDIYHGNGGEGSRCGDATTLFSYVADFNSLEIWDVSDATDPLFCGAIGTTDELLGDGPVLAADFFVDPDSSDRVVALATGDGARGVIVNDPTRPEVDPDLVYVTPEEFGDLRESQHILVEPDAQFAALPSWPAGLQLLATDDGEVFLIDRLETGSAFFTAALCGELLCATEGQDGLALIGFNGEELVRVGDNVPIGDEGDWAWDLEIDGCTAYVTAGDFETGTGTLEIVPLPGCGAVPAAAVLDGDGDGVPDAQDNCSATANADQTDADLDGYGNLCDADYDGDGVTQVSDYNRLVQGFGKSEGEPGFDAALDNDGDGTIQISDFNIWAQRFGQPPGPSGLGCAGTTPCP